ncbi:MAG TPA: ABC transporter substrate-binding protein [Methylomirabilota bacterium]|jgi:putative ABC transport system substrate-binding protein|nr:ABC transporter substrate-binding protein [Methylomirabilota bacterium]
MSRSRILRIAGRPSILALGFLAAVSAAHGQQAPKVARVGFLASSSSGYLNPSSILAHLNVLGYVAGKDVVSEYRSAAGRDEHLPALAAELVRLKVDVIVPAGRPAILAAKAATRTIPIVIAAEGDPVAAGLVASLARPGGNVTGMAILLPELSAKRLELLKEAVPRLTRVGVLWSPGDTDRVEEWNSARAAGRALGLEVESLEVRSREDLRPAVVSARKKRVGALLVLEGLVTGGNPKIITDAAAQNRLPAMYPRRVFVDSWDYAGLISYEPDAQDLSRRIASYIDRILKGAKPADLPVEQPTKFELVVNLKTAKAIGLRIPPSLLVRADRVIE